MRVLIAEDDKNVASLLAAFVGRCGHEVAEVVTMGGMEVIRSYGRCQPDAVIMDIMMPGFNGITITHALLSRNPNAKIALVSGQFEADHPFVQRAGAAAFLPKPFHYEQVRQVLAELEASREAGHSAASLTV